MLKSRAAVTYALALSLAACGGGGNSSSPPPSSSSSSSSSGGTSTTNPPDPCSLSNRQDWARDVLEEWYLFPESLNLNVNKANYNSLQAYIDALVAGAPGEDKGFTYVTSIKEENDLIQNGSNAGFGVRLVYDVQGNRVFVAEAFEAGPALPAGIDRGTQILSINGQSVSSLMASGGPQAVINALGPSDPGLSRDLVFADASGVQRSATIAKTEYSLDPISDRYGVKILNDGTQQVGYVNLRTFIIEDAQAQLRSAFRQFKSEGIEKVILDLRYNGGGLVDTAELLGDLMGGGLEGQVFSKTMLRESKSSRNSTRLFQTQPETITVTNMAVIGAGGTASASELVTNSFIPYLGTNLALVGTNTYGKPVGQYGFDLSECDDRLRAVTFKTTNAEDQGDYFDGLAPVMDRTCFAYDGIFTPLGDPQEESIAAALDYLAGRSCTSIMGGSMSRTATSRSARQEVLQPERPNTFQRENPGVF